MATLSLGGPFSTSTPAGLTWRVAVLVATGLVALGLTIAMDPFPQNLDYLEFVDTRPLLGLHNALNVLSNVPFALVGVVGLLLLRRGAFVFQDQREGWLWAVFLVGVTLTSLGSAWFHYQPTLDSLVWDRLPMTVAFMGLLTALVAERISPAAALWLVGPLVAAGLASVGYWISTEHAHHGDLRFYLLVQYYSLAAVLQMLLLFRGAYTASSWLLVGLAAYVAAKWAEIMDREIFAALRVLSGHTLKHVLAAGGIAVVVAMLRYRRLRRHPLT